MQWHPRRAAPRTGHAVVLDLGSLELHSSCDAWRQFLEPTAVEEQDCPDLHFAAKLAPYLSPLQHQLQISCHKRAHEETIS